MSGVAQGGGCARRHPAWCSSQTQSATTNSLLRFAVCRLLPLTLATDGKFTSHQLLESIGADRFINVVGRLNLVRPNLEP